MSPSTSVLKIHILNLKNISKEIHKLHSPKYLIGALTILTCIYFTSRYYFLSIHTNINSKITFGPPLPGRQAQAHTGLPHLIAAFFRAITLEPKWENSVEHK